MVFRGPLYGGEWEGKGRGGTEREKRDRKEKMGWEESWNRAADWLRLALSPPIAGSATAYKGSETRYGVRTGGHEVYGVLLIANPNPITNPKPNPNPVCYTVANAYYS